MAAKNLQRINVEGGYYHVYNRGVEKRIIFQDKQDYTVFLSYLKEYLSPAVDPLKTKVTFTLQALSFQGIPHQPKNYNKKLELIAYCLIPNHLHLLLHQIDKGSVEKFLRSICTRYSMYFNKKYDRVGSLFQGPYKSVLIQDENYLLHLSRYIHLNPSEYTKDLTQAYSSYSEYLGIRKTDWIHPESILQYFNNSKNDFIKGTNTYKDFVEKYNKNPSLLENIVLDD